jgi:hypothetical protein
VRVKKILKALLPANTHCPNGNEASGEQEQRAGLGCCSYRHVAGQFGVIDGRPTAVVLYSRCVTRVARGRAYCLKKTAFADAPSWEESSDRMVKPPPEDPLKSNRKSEAVSDKSSPLNAQKSAVFVAIALPNGALVVRSNPTISDCPIVPSVPSVVMAPMTEPFPIARSTPKTSFALARCAKSVMKCLWKYSC